MSPPTGTRSPDSAVLPTLALFSVVAIKLLVVAHGDYRTAAALVNAAGPVTVAFSVLLGEAPIIILGLALAWGFYVTTDVVSDARRRLTTWLLGAAVVVEFFIAPFAVLFASAAAFLSFRWMLHLLKKGSAPLRSAFGQRGWRTIRGVAIVMFLMGLAGGAIFSDRPWLPSERVTTKSGTLVGYVVEVGAEWTTLLVAKDRRVVRVRSDDVEARQVCREADYGGIASDIFFGRKKGGRTASAALFGWARPEYPACA